MEFKVLRIEGIHSKGLGTNSGQGEVGIGVLVQCYMECNKPMIYRSILLASCSWYKQYFECSPPLLFLSPST